MFLVRMNNLLELYDLLLEDWEKTLISRVLSNFLLLSKKLVINLTIKVFDEDRMSK